MAFFSRLFAKKTHLTEQPLIWDMHSHILPGIDDGAKTENDSLGMAGRFIQMGYKQLIATPHVLQPYYPNGPEIVNEKTAVLNNLMLANNMTLNIQGAGEYYIDEALFGMVEKKERLMSFHNGHVLVETSFMNKPVFFEQLIFMMKSEGYQPVFAHPERYVYLQRNYEELERIAESGIKLQINLLSLAGYYSPAALKMAEWMIKNNHYHFIGTDAHNEKHLEKIAGVMQGKLYSKIDFGKVENAREYNNYSTL